MSVAVQEMFNGIAGRYDFMNHFLSLNRDKAWRSRAVRMLGTLPGLDVLDLCGGTGDFQQALRERYPSARTVVGDFSIPMLAVSRQKFPDVPALGVDAMQLPFASQKFHVVLNGFGMRNLDSNEKGLEEVARVLHSGGRFVTLEFFRPQGWFTKSFYALSTLLFPVVGKLLAGGRAEAYKYLAESVRRYLSVGEYCKLATERGFVLEQMRPCDGGIAWIVVLRKK